MSTQIAAFRMPRFREIPDVGLYLDQTVKYINRFLSALGCMEVTSSMVSNYVKQGYIASPVRKQYSAEQIARLFFIAIAKSVMSMENIGLMFSMQKETCPSDVAYDYFCEELENVLAHTFGLKDELAQVGTTASTPKQMLRSVIIAVANIIYLSSCFEDYRARLTKPATSQAEADAAKPDA